MRVILLVAIVALCLSTVGAINIHSQSPHRRRLARMESNLARFRATSDCSCVQCPCAEDKFSLQNHVLLKGENNEQVKKLEAHAQEHVLKFLNKVYAADIWLKLSSPVPNGHAIRFKLLKGSESKVETLGDECHLRVFDGQIETPLHGEYVGGEANKHKGERYDPNKGGAKGELYQTIKHELSADQKREAEAQNDQQISRLDSKACGKLRKFVRALAEQHNTVIRLYGAIANGHTVDYQLLHGKTQTVIDIAHKFSSVSAEPGRISVDGDDKVEAEAEEGLDKFADVIKEKPKNPL
jgi:hypothetical protein